jgi:hypothetical protein
VHVYGHVREQGAAPHRFRTGSILLIEVAGHMAEVIDFVARLPKRHRSAELVCVSPLLLSSKDHSEALRDFLSQLPQARPLVLDAQGAELLPEAIATLFFFALDHQDRHGVLEVRNVGTESFALLEGLGADCMPMVKFIESEDSRRIH